jgi:hypothetical protein
MGFPSDYWNATQLSFPSFWLLFVGLLYDFTKRFADNSATVGVKNKFYCHLSLEQKLIAISRTPILARKLRYLMSNSTLNRKSETPLVTVPSQPSLRKHAFYGIEGGCLLGEDSPSKGERGRMRI